MRRRFKSVFVFLRRIFTWRTLALLNTALIIFCAALLANIELFEFFNGLPANLVTLLTGITAVLGIMWQTRKGFQNLTASQRHQSQLDRKARLEQAELEITITEKKRAVEAKALASALRGELVAAHDFACKTASYSRRIKLIMEGLGEHGIGKAGFIQIGRFKSDIYEANIRNLSLLNVSLVGDLVKVYSRLNAAPNEPHPDQKFPIEHLIVAYEALASSYDDLVKDAYHVAMRLRAFELDEQDPGSLSQRTLPTEQPMN